MLGTEKLSPPGTAGGYGHLQAPPHQDAWDAIGYRPRRNRGRSSWSAPGLLPRAEASLASRAASRTSPSADNVANPDNKGWSLYGAPWLQLVAVSGKSDRRGSRPNKRNPLPPAATGCLRRSMVSRASAVGCHPLREVPSLRRRGSTEMLARAISCCCSPGTDTGRNRCRCMPGGSWFDFSRFIDLAGDYAATSRFRDATGSTTPSFERSSCSTSNP